MYVYAKSMFCHTMLLKQVKFMINYFNVIVRSSGVSFYEPFNPYQSDPDLKTPRFAM